jgi:autotransporter-associated beta strand protein
VSGTINTRAGAGGTKTIASSNTSGTNTYVSSIFFDSDATVLSANSGAVVAFTGPAFDIKNHALLVIGSGNTDIKSPIINSTAGGSLTKSDSGTLILEGTNSYSGSTTISNGTLKLNGINGGAGAVTIGSGATLTGNGSIAGPVILSGAVKPGNSVGTLSTGPETWNGGASFTAEVIDATNVPGIGFDSLNITGGINLQAVSTNPFTINLVSLDSSGNPGLVSNFDNNSSYSWTIASTIGGGVTNFDPSVFTLATSTFSNDLAGGYFFLESGSLKVSFTNNHPPSAALVTLARPRDFSIKILLSDLATNWSDLDGDAVSLVNVFADSTNGVGNVTTNGGYLLYSPGTNGNVTDLVSYTIRDQRATYRPGDTIRTTSGNILITIAPDTNAQSVNITGIQTLPDGNTRISFAGIPNRTYLVQGATNLTFPIPWQTLSTNVAGTNGLWYFDDLDATNYSSRYYRSAQP